jgi:hypothetical protein
MQAHYLEQTARSTAALDERRPRISFRWLSAVRKRIDRWFLGGSTPRAGARREFPEVEFHQVLSGKRDHFDPLR